MPALMTTASPRRHRLHLLGILLTVLIFFSAIWAAFALWFQLQRAPELIQWLLPFAWLLFAGVALASYWRAHVYWPPVAYVVAFAGLLLWWFSLAPSNDRVWADEVARALDGSVDGDIVTLHNVRNFTWRTPTDYDIRWEDRQFDLRRLVSTDMALSYWMGPAIAHTLVSFGFDDGRYLTFSIEIRKEHDEQFSAIGGMFKQFELSLVAAEESDILRVRTNARAEDVYLYRINLSDEARRSLFLAYVAQAQELATQPRFYSTFTANCTVIVYQMVKKIISGLPVDYRLLASGYLPEYLSEVDGLEEGYSVAALRERGRITQRARTMPADADFSTYIRRGIPGMPQSSQESSEDSAVR